MQAETEQRPHKVSFYVDKTKAQAVMKELSSRLEKRGVRFNLLPSMLCIQSYALFPSKYT